MAGENRSDTGIAFDQLQHVSRDVSEVLGRKISSCHVLLRELSLILPPRCVGKDWLVVSNSLSDQGFQVRDVWGNGTAFNYDFLIATNAFSASYGYSLDLCLMLSVESVGCVEPTQRVGRVISANATLVANVNGPFSDIRDKKRFPNGSAMEKALLMSDVKATGVIWPLVRQIRASYGLLYDRWAEYSPSGITVSVEFATDPAAIGTRTLTYAFESGLDPNRTREGKAPSGHFAPTDTIRGVQFLGYGESWRGDDEEVKKAKFRYLNERSVSP